MTPLLTPTLTPSIAEMLPYGVNAVVYFLLFIFVVYGLFLSYHWFMFGTSRHVSMIAFVTYFIGGGILFLILSLSL